MRDVQFNLTCEPGGTAAGELVHLVHAHALVQTGRGHTLVHLRFTHRAFEQGNESTSQNRNIFSMLI